MKKTVLTLLLLSIPLLASAQLKVGVMNPDAVLDALPETAQVEEQLQQYVDERQQNFQQQYQQWIQEVSEFSQQAESGTLSEAEQAEMEERLSEQQEELNNLQNRIQRQIQQRQSELFNPLLTSIDNAMNEVASELGIDFVINKTAGSGDPIVYYSSQRANDITDQVIEKLTQN